MRSKCRVDAVKLKMFYNLMYDPRPHLPWSPLMADWFGDVIYLKMRIVDRGPSHPDWGLISRLGRGGLEHLRVKIEAAIMLVACWHGENCTAEQQGAAIVWAQQVCRKITEGVVAGG